MKKAGIALLMGIVFFSGCAKKQESKIYPYSFNSAKITFALDGAMKGSSIFYIKGDRSARETHVISQSTPTPENRDELFIDTGDAIYQVDLNKKTGITAKNPVYEELKKQSPENRAIFLKRLAVGLDPADLTKTDDMKPLREETVAGQKCEVYQVQNIGEICLWNYLILKVDIAIPGQEVGNKVVATSIELNVDISDDKFKIPEGVQIENVNPAQAN